MKPPDYSSVKQDIDSLQFLIDNDNAQILMELTIEQERFKQAINSINIRNEFYVNEVQPALSFHALNGRPRVGLTPRSQSRNWATLALARTLAAGSSLPLVVVPAWAAP